MRNEDDGAPFARVFDELFPEGVGVAEMPDRLGDPDLLSAAERAQVAGAVDRRRREYAAVRQLAHPLLAACGAPPGPLLNGPDRAPRWPDGIVGSLSHCTGHAVAVVASAERFVALGCDVEPAEPLPSEVIRQLLLPEEITRLARAPAWLGRLMFSAKETFHKAQYPSSRAWLDFDAVAIAPDLDAGTFTVSVRRDGASFPRGCRLRGRFAVRGGHLGTALAVPAPG